MTEDGRQWIEGLPDEMAGQREIMLRLLDWSQHGELVRFLVVACSVGRGAGDRLSDLDMGMGVAAEDFDAAVTEVGRAIDELPGLVESYHHKLAGITTTHERIFAQYANRCQVDLVMIPVTETWGGVKDEVVLYDPDRRRTVRFEPSPVTPAQAREWAFNGWNCLADVGKYLRRGSAWEALERLHQARAEYWRLLATAAEVANPQFGITSLLDFAPDAVPADLARTVSQLDHGGLLRAARRLADELTEVGELLPAELRAALPAAMADYIRADLADLSLPH